MKPQLLRIATRKSPLALWQANHIREKLLSFWPHLQITLVPMSTSGDTFTKDKLLALGGKGLFVKELEEALLDNRADLAVHSMKDVPAHFPQGLTITTITKRSNPLDALVSLEFPNLASLPLNSIIGTSSLRRQAQLLALRPDLQIRFLRGNINTRLDKLQGENFQAIILAAAGLERMNMQHVIAEILSEDIMLPACGQGALGIECRIDDENLHSLLAPLNDPVSALCVSVERQVNARLGGNCHVPVAVYCTATNAHTLFLRARVCSQDGSSILETQHQGSSNQPLELANLCAQTLLDKGASKLLMSDLP